MESRPKHDSPNPRILIPTPEEVEEYATPMLAEYTQIFTDTFLKITMGFFYRRGGIPKLVYDIASVWSRGLADLSDAECWDQVLVDKLIAYKEKK